MPESLSENGIDDSASNFKRVRTIDELQQLERYNICLALDEAGWQVSGRGGAAELLNMNPATLSSRIKALDIRRPDPAA